jgi:hypothetical protein
MTIFKEWLNWDKFNMNFIRNYKISIVKLKLRHVFISNCIQVGNKLYQFLQWLHIVMILLILGQMKIWHN